jgi:hypothetical protein
VETSVCSSVYDVVSGISAVLKFHLEGNIVRKFHFSAYFIYVVSEPILVCVRV